MPTVSPLKRIIRPVEPSVPRSAAPVGSAGGELVPEPGDHEQAVVDREPEAEPDHDVDHEHVDLHHVRQQPQQEQGGDDREHPYDQRQRRRHESAEDQQREQEQQRRRVKLDPAQVVLGRLVQLVRGHGGPSGRDEAHPPEGLLDLLADVGYVVDVRVQVADHQPRPLVLREPLMRGTGDARDVGQAPLGLRRGRPHLGRAALGGLDYEDDVRKRPFAARVLERLCRSRALGVRVLEAVGLDRVEHRSAADGGRNGDQKSGQHDSAPPAVGVVPEAPHRGDHMEGSATGATLNNVEIGHRFIRAVRGRDLVGSRKCHLPSVPRSNTLPAWPRRSSSTRSATG